MQHTTIRRARHFGGQAMLAGTMIMMAAFGAFVASRTLAPPQSSAETPAIPAAAARPRARAFADEAAYIPSAAEYAALPADEAYLPLPAAPAGTVARPRARAFADEAAYIPSAAEYAALPADEAYLPLPAAPAGTAGRPRARAFADEAAYIPSAAEYVGAALAGDWQAPAGSPR